MHATRRFLPRWKEYKERKKLKRVMKPSRATAVRLSVTMIVILSSTISAAAATTAVRLAVSVSVTTATTAMVTAVRIGVSVDGSGTAPTVVGGEAATIVSSSIIPSF